MTQPDGGIRVRRSPVAISRRVGTDVLVTTLGDEDVHELSGGASAVWADLDVPRTQAELVERLAAEHDVAPGDIAADVAVCIGTLTGIGVVEEVGDDLDG